MRLNDPRGQTYFYKEANKIFFVNHIDSKNIVHRKANDQDKKDYPDIWEKWKKKA